MAGLHPPRDLVTSGQLQELVEEDGLSGVTANPTILEKAIAGGNDYDESLRALLQHHPEMGAEALYEALAITDIQMAADVLRPVYDRTGGADGYVSLELSPAVANDTEKTIAEAHRLWRALARPNVMLKVPATAAGILAIERLTSEGLNINGTLIFSLENYTQVAPAYIRGLEKWIAAGGDPKQVASVASFFVSRVDTAVDRVLEAIGNSEALSLRGKAAVANAKLAYERFRALFSGGDFAALIAKGGRVQRPLWASTGTKNAAYPELLYVEELIGPDTVNTLPPSTLHGAREKVQPRASLEEGVEAARQVFVRLQHAGVDLTAVTQRLQEEGVAAFADSYRTLLEVLEGKRQAVVQG